MRWSLVAGSVVALGACLWPVDANFMIDCNYASAKVPAAQSLAMTVSDAGPVVSYSGVAQTAIGCR